MKIIEILADNKLEAKTKLKSVKELVDSVRGVYGNKDVEITSVKVNSVNGMVSVGLLTKAEKVAVAEQAIRKCIGAATAITEVKEGAIFDRAFEALVATDGLLCNLSEKSDSAY